MSDILARWNRLPAGEAEVQILACCGAKTWAWSMAVRRPFADDAALLTAAEDAWRNLGESGWSEAFRSHPRIGETRAEGASDPRSAGWSAQEQRAAGAAGDAVKMALAEANREYENRFDRIFVVCASGKTAAEILQILRRRLQNEPETELREAVEQQWQIIQLRIKRWLAE